MLAFLSSWAYRGSGSARGFQAHGFSWSLILVDSALSTLSMQRRENCCVVAGSNRGLHLEIPALIGSGLDMDRSRGFQSIHCRGIQSCSTEPRNPVEDVSCRRMLSATCLGVPRGQVAPRQLFALPAMGQLFHRCPATHQPP